MSFKGLLDSMVSDHGPFKLTENHLHVMNHISFAAFKRFFLCTGFQQFSQVVYGCGSL